MRPIHRLDILTLIHTLHALVIHRFPWDILEFLLRALEVLLDRLGILHTLTMDTLMEDALGIHTLTGLASLHILHLRMPHIGLLLPRPKLFRRPLSNCNLQTLRPQM